MRLEGEEAGRARPGRSGSDETGHLTDLGTLQLAWPLRARRPRSGRIPNRRRIFSAQNMGNRTLILASAVSVV